MAARKSKPVPKLDVHSASHAALTLKLTLPVLKPRNRLAMNPLLRKSAAHNNTQRRDPRTRDKALEEHQGVHDALNRRHAADKGGSDGSDSQ